MAMTYSVPELVSLGNAQNLVLAGPSNNQPTCFLDNGSTGDESVLLELW
jgi:hypothetical protein